jgi:hypothetical protein
MDIMIIAIIGEQDLKRIPRELVPTMIVHSLCRRDRKEEDRLSRSHERATLRQSRAEGVEDEPFERVVVEGSKGVGDVEAVVDRVDVAVEETVGVEVAVPEVLPAVEDEAVGWGFGDEVGIRERLARKGKR